jgi:ADP-heptose:LPS heptosyltransferase
MVDAPLGSVPLVDPRRIAVLPGFGIGDAVFVIPALRALAARFPAAELTVLGAPWLVELLGPPRGPAHEVVAIPAAATAWLRLGESWGEPGLQAFLKELAARRFDLAVQLFGGGRTSNRFTAAIGAQVTVGLRAPDAPPLNRTVRYAYWQSEVARHLEVVGLVGAAPVELDPSLPVLKTDRTAARSALQARREDPLIEAADGRRLALLIPGAGDGRRRWPPEAFAALAARLAEMDLDVAIVGARDDAALARAIATRASTSVTDLTGETSISALIGLGSMAALAVGNDTGPTHVLAAAGAPTVAIFWCGNLVNAGRLFRDRYRPLLSWRLDCPVCGISCISGTCAHDASFVDEITAEDVEAQARDLLGVRSSVSPPRAPGCRAGRSCCRRRSGGAPGRGRPTPAPGRSRASPPS